MIRPTRALRARPQSWPLRRLVLSCCGGDDDARRHAATSPSATSTAAAKTGDGTLTIGTLLPQTGDLAFLGPPEFAGVDLAIKDINAAGGVLGKDVAQVEGRLRRRHARHRAAVGRQAARANADVIVGAASSSVSLSVIDKIIGAGVVQFSPANTVDRRSTRYDDKDLYFRTAPSDVLQGECSATWSSRTASRTSRSSPARTPTVRLSPSRSRRPSRTGAATSSTKVLYSADATNFTAEVNKITAAKPDAVVADRLQRDHQDHPGADRQGHRPAGRPGLLRRRQHRRLLEGLPEGHPRRASRRTFPGAELTRRLQGAPAGDRPEAQGLHLRS